MQRLEMNRYQPSFSKQHETKLQQLRHERTVEVQHLDGLKKALQTKLQAYSAENRQVRVA
jgi:hypothetical protein